jgi:hypothetical protein
VIIWKCKSSVFYILKKISVGHWWLMPVILATQEAEIRRIVAPSQPRKTALETILKQPFTKKG